MTDHMDVDLGAGRQRRVPVDYPANSKKAKQQAKPEKLAAVVTGEVKTRKRGLRERVAGALLSEDSSTVVGYVVMEVLVPAVKNMVSDAVSQGIERILFGDARPRPGSGRPGYTNYSRYSERGPRPSLSRQDRALHNFDDIILETRVEAEEVIEMLREAISLYGWATVSDLYDLVGLTAQFTDDKWGWNDLRSASIRQIRGGYLLNLPRTVPLT